METFDLKAHLNGIYASFPEAEHRVVIGITGNYENGDLTLRDRYYKQVVEAGGVPLVIPPVADKNVIINTLEHIDGLLLTGGADINPLWGDEEPLPMLHAVNAERDLPELLITRLAYNRQIPILGICRGMQTLAFALGGRVIQGVDNMPDMLKHSQDAARNEPTHSVRIAEDSILHKLYGTDRMFVNSFHHQAVKETGAHFLVTATAPDSIIEAMESCEYKAMMGVQWHPEWLEKDGLKLFDWLVEQAKLFCEAKEVHKRVLTLDTHCDTPMFFPMGIRFDQRDDRILVDLHKMADGRQDAVTMVAYLPSRGPKKAFRARLTLMWKGRQSMPILFSTR